MHLFDLGKSLHCSELQLHHPSNGSYHIYPKSFEVLLRSSQEMTEGKLLWKISLAGVIKASSIWGSCFSSENNVAELPGSWVLLPFLPSLPPPPYSKQRLSPKRTIPCLMIKGTMGFLSGPLGPQTGALQSRMPNKPGDFGARRQLSYRLRTKDSAHFCISAVVTHQLSMSMSTCVPVLGKP